MDAVYVLYIVQYSVDANFQMTLNPSYFEPDFAGKSGFGSRRFPMSVVEIFPQFNTRVFNMTFQTRQTTLIIERVCFKPGRDQTPHHLLYLPTLPTSTTPNYRVDPDQTNPLDSALNCKPVRRWTGSCWERGKGKEWVFWVEKGGQRWIASTGGVGFVRIYSVCRYIRYIR